MTTAEGAKVAQGAQALNLVLDLSSKKKLVGPDGRLSDGVRNLIDQARVGLEDMLLSAVQKSEQKLSTASEAYDQAKSLNVQLRLVDGEGKPTADADADKPKKTRKAKATEEAAADVEGQATFEEAPAAESTPDPDQQPEAQTEATEPAKPALDTSIPKGVPLVVKESLRHTIKDGKQKAVKATALATGKTVVEISAYWGILQDAGELVHDKANKRWFFQEDQAEQAAEDAQPADQAPAAQDNVIAGPWPGADVTEAAQPAEAEQAASA